MKPHPLVHCLALFVNTGGAVAALPPSDPVPVVLGQPTGDLPTWRTTADIDDEVPRPQPAVWASGEQSDLLVKPAGGDPFFLGFVGGRYYPPSGDRLDPMLGEAIANLGVDARPHDDVYAFIMLGKRLTDARLDALLQLGVRPLGLQPHYALQAAVPVAALAEVAAHPAVRWVGVARPWQKLQPHLAQRFAGEPGAEQEVYINVFESDLGKASLSLPGAAPQSGGPGQPTSTGKPEGARWMSHGWMEHALRQRGVLITEYLPGQLAFRARLRQQQLASVLAMDCVQFVEAAVRAEAQHDESMPMIFADWGRDSFDGSVSQQVYAGIVDSGVDTAHSALAHLYWVAWNDTQSAGNGVSDPCGHGSHVAGTILAAPGPADSSIRGGAPGLATWPSGRFRVVKYLADNCVSDGASLSTVLSHFRGTFVDSFGVGSPPPVVVNNSWGSSGSWAGTELNARTIDDEVYDEDRLFVFSAGNDGPTAGTISLPAVAKNALTVGSVYDYRSADLAYPGTVANNSSRGPCADGRWKPNVNAPGSDIVSIGANSGSGYVPKSGTSMAAPHVTALIAQLADQNAQMRHSPERVMSLLQATALTKDDALLTSENDTHLDNYGCGRVTAAKILSPSSSEWAWSSWEIDPTATFNNPTAEFADFLVPANTRRLVVCMTYIEPAALSGAAQAVQHNWDLFIDQPPVSAAGNVGDYTQQQSPVDNTEIRIIDDPIAGVWRWKAFPTNILAPILPSAKMAVTVVAITSDTTPTTSLSMTTSDAFVRPGETVDIKATVTNTAYVASAVFLDSTVGPVQPTFVGASTKLIDGPVTNLLGNHHFGRDLLLGDILAASARSATWSVWWPSEGLMNFAANVLSDNTGAPLASVNVTVDGTPPGLPATLLSTSHQANVWSNNDKLQMTWSAATDNLSGVAGYSVAASGASPMAPDDSIDTTGTSYSLTLPDTPIGAMFNLKVADRSGNWSTGFKSAGPYKIDTVLPDKVGGLLSSTHQPNVWSNDNTITYKWQAAADAHSGIAGYSILTTTGASGTPNQTVDIGAVTAHGETLTSSTSGYYFNIRSADFAGNWDDATATVGPFLIDSLAPTAPSNLASPSHQVGVTSTNQNVTVTWIVADDAHSGVGGYATLWDHSPTTTPPATINWTANLMATVLAPAAEGWWFHLRAIDNAGNAGPPVHLGPLQIGLCSQPAGSASYGIGKPGQFGIPQLVATVPPAVGTTAAVEIQFALPGALPILLLGAAPTSVAFEGGFLLVNPTFIATLPVPIGAGGTLPLAGALPFDGSLCGANLYLQALIPDPGAGGVNHLAMTPGLTLTIGS